MAEKQIQYTCKILPFGNLLTIILATNVGLGMTFICIFLGLPVFITIALMLGSMYALLYLMSTFATFEIKELQLSRLLENKSFLFNNSRYKDYTWQEVKSYKSGKDKGRYRGEFQFLEIFFLDGKSWKFTDMYGERKTTFDIFKTTFIEKINSINASARKTDLLYTPSQNLQNSTNSAAEIKDRITRKKTFYETGIAKIITIFFVVFSAGIIYFYLTHPAYIRINNLFKIAVVILPGTGYMIFRTFYKADSD